MSAHRTETPVAAELVRFARWVTNHTPESYCDHACRECVPDGEIVREGFQCVVHRARAIVQEADHG